VRIYTPDASRSHQSGVASASSAVTGTASYHTYRPTLTVVAAEIRRLIGGYTAAVDTQVDQHVTDELIDAQLRRVLDVVKPTNNVTSRIHIPTSVEAERDDRGNLQKWVEPQRVAASDTGKVTCADLPPIERFFEFGFQPS
jgi:hypothetical protein